MNCKAKVRTSHNGIFNNCSQKAVIMGLCINHYTMMMYGKKNYKKKGDKHD